MYNICLWNYADGSYAYMNRALVQSLKDNGVNYDFHSFGDYVPNAINHGIKLNPEQKKHYLFKFTVLYKYVIDLPYDYFIFIDADSYCVRNPENMIQACLRDSPVHSFLESDCTDSKCVRADWWGCPLPKYIDIMRRRGVISEKIYNVNAGFWGVHKKAIKQFYGLAMEFWYFCKSEGYMFTEEAPLAYVTHMMCGDVELHTQRNWYNLWCSDWTGHFRGRVPADESWEFTDYMTNEKHLVRPAIVHAMRSKLELIHKGMSRV